MIKPTISIPAALLATLLLAAPFSTQAATYRFRTIDVPFSGAADSSAAGINDSGQIVGYYYDSSSEHGFLDENGTFTSIDDPNAKPDPNGWSDTRAYGINDSGQIVGHYYDANGHTHAFIRDPADPTWTTLDYPNADVTLARGIDRAGNTIVGYYHANSANRAFRYDRSTNAYSSLNDPAWNAEASYAWGINDSDQIVGYYFSGTDQRNYGFRFSNGTYTTLSVPNATDTYARGINNLGMIVGSYRTGSGRYGFLYDGSHYITLSDPQGIGTTTALDINDAGQIVGYYEDSAGARRSFLATPVPLPGSALLMGSGLLLVGGMRRRARP
jgi:probable HAF family extracellular repeat protein